MQVEIEGSPTLVRDVTNRAILNKDRTGLHAARARKKAILERDGKQKSLEDRVSQLNIKMERIESLLMKLVERG